MGKVLGLKEVSGHGFAHLTEKVHNSEKQIKAEFAHNDSSGLAEFIKCRNEMPSLLPWSPGPSWPGQMLAINIEHNGIELSAVDCIKNNEGPPLSHLECKVLNECTYTLPMHSMSFQLKGSH